MPSPSDDVLVTRVAQMKRITRSCECCGKPHQCYETFSEMVERYARKRTGEIIVE